MSDSDPEPTPFVPTVVSVKETGLAGLIGTEDYIIPYKRVASTQDDVLLTPCTAKISNNGSHKEYVPTAGVIPIVAILENKADTWEYPTLTVGATTINGAGSGEYTVLEDEYNFYDVGVYYKNTSTGEVFYVISKRTVSTTYKVSITRGILGTTPAAFTASTDVIAKLNTIKLNSRNTEGTAGNYGSGFVIYKEIPRNLAYGQKKYPSSDFYTIPYESGN